jgi:hypothetical protein
MSRRSEQFPDIDRCRGPVSSDDRPAAVTAVTRHARRAIDVSLAGLLLTGGLVLGCAGGAEEGPQLLSGVVVDTAGQPVADARVALAAAPVEVPDIAVLTGEDGRFSIGVPVPGAYRVTAHADQGHAEEAVDVERGRTARVQLVLQP